MELKIGSVLPKLVKERRYTLRAISRATGVPVSTLSEWQASRCPKDPTQVKKVAQFLGVTLEGEMGVSTCARLRDAVFCRTEH